MSVRKSRAWVGLVCLSAWGCSQSVPPELANARKAYDQASKGPAAELTPAQLYVAKKTLVQAEKSFDQEGDSFKTRDRAYVAMRKAQIADAQARTVQAEQEEQKWQKQAEMSEQQALSRAQQSLSETQQELEAERARREQAEARAEQAAAELGAIGSVTRGEGGMVITLGGVLFESGKAQLTPTAEQKLSKVVTALNRVESQSSLLVKGHTDSRGSAQFNKKLSQERADAVREYLVSQGIADDRVRAEGMGEERPMASNDTPEGRANNRRVEIVVESAEPSGAQGGQQGPAGHMEHGGEGPMHGTEPLPERAQEQPPNEAPGAGGGD